MDQAEFPTDLEALYQRVRGLHLRIKKTPQATPWICQQADGLAAPLDGLIHKLNAQPGQAQYDVVFTRLIEVRAALHELFAEQLNPLMDSNTEE